MKSIRLFFAGITIFSLAFFATTIVPKSAHATPKMAVTGEYPEAECTRGSDVDYASKTTD